MSGVRKSVAANPLRTSQGNQRRNGTPLWAAVPVNLARPAPVLRDYGCLTRLRTTPGSFGMSSRASFLTYVHVSDGDVPQLFEGISEALDFHPQCGGQKAVERMPLDDFYAGKKYTRGDIPQRPSCGQDP